MFIRGIVVPVLIVCLILFIGVSYNDANADTNTDTNRGANTTNNGTDTNLDNTTYQNGITTTPIINRPGMNNDTINNADGTSMGLNNNGLGTFTITETQLKNELERINGLGTVYVDVVNETAYIIKNGEDTLNQSMSIGNVSIRDEIIRTVKNIDRTIRKVCVLDNSNVYGSYNSNRTIPNLNSYETASNVIYVS